MKTTSRVAGARSVNATGHGRVARNMWCRIAAIPAVSARSQRCQRDLRTGPKRMRTRRVGRYMKT